jgi:hypothetical protein
MVPMGVPNRSENWSSCIRNALSRLFRFLPSTVKSPGLCFQRTQRGNQCHDNGLRLNSKGQSVIIV